MKASYNINAELKEDVDKLVDRSTKMQIQMDDANDKVQKVTK